MSTNTTIIHLPENCSPMNLMKRIQDNLENEGYEVFTSIGKVFRSANIRKNGFLVARVGYSVTGDNYRSSVWGNKITVTWYVNSQENHPWITIMIRSAVR